MLTNLLVFFVSTLYFFSNPPINYNLNINIENIKTRKGILHVAIYNTKKDFLKKNNLVYKKEINSESITPCTFNLPEGKYAVSVYHDENSNNILDKNKLGIPLEAYSFSNNIRPKFRAPRFSEASFDLVKDKTINIAIKKWP